MLSRLVGAKGKVIGVDMTEAQLAVAKQHIDYHMNAFGYEQPNVEFHFGYFSNVFAGRRVPEHLQHDRDVLGECLGGASASACC